MRLERVIDAFRTQIERERSVRLFLSSTESLILDDEKCAVKNELERERKRYLDFIHTYSKWLSNLSVQSSEQNKRVEIHDHISNKCVTRTNQ